MTLTRMTLTRLSRIALVAAVCGLIATPAMGDIAWGDSPTFALDLGVHGPVWADSPTFALDLGQVEVHGPAWADSPTFALDTTLRLVAEIPADQQSLWRSANNTIRLTFDGDITVPGAGQVLIQKMLDGGLFAPDLSANFTFTIENVDIGGGVMRPRVLRIRENGSVLPHRTWIAIRNAETPKRQNTETETPKSQNAETDGVVCLSEAERREGEPPGLSRRSSGDGAYLSEAERNEAPLHESTDGRQLNWIGVAPFEVQYMVMVGDVNADRKVLASDLSSIFPKIPTAAAGDQERADVNGDGKVLANDLSAVFPRIPSAAVPKPSGH